MTYELAKELKDAGFPLGCRGCRVCLDGPAQTGKECLMTLDCTCHLPTLSELIEACGEVTFNLKHDPPSAWVAWVGSDVNDMRAGFTPEEAVARLWLALQGVSDAPKH